MWPIREALRVLHNEGLVEYPPTRGVVVRMLDRRHVCELFDIREMLEILAARQAAERVAEGAETRLPVMVDQSHQAVLTEDVAAAYAVNSQLHDEITELSGNALLAEMLKPLRGQVGWLRRKIKDFDLIQAEHEELCRAITAGEPDRAAEAACDHVRASRARTLRFLFGS